MLLRQTFIETRKTLAHPALWLGLGGLSLLLAGFIVILHLQIANGYQPAAGGLEQDMIDSLVFFGYIGSLVVGVCAAVIVAYDYPDRSIQIWLTRGQARTALLLARLAAALLFGLAMVGYTIIACLGLAAVSRLAFFGQVDAAQLNWLALPAAALRVYWAQLPYLALTVLLAVVSRSPLFAVIGTALYATLIEPMLPALIARLPEGFTAWIAYLPGQLSRVLQENLARLSLTAQLPQPPLPETQAALLIGLIAAALIGAAVVVFERQDLGG